MDRLSMVAVAVAAMAAVAMVAGLGTGTGSEVDDLAVTAASLLMVAGRPCLYMRCRCRRAIPNCGTRFREFAPRTGRPTTPVAARSTQHTRRGTRGRLGLLAERGEDTADARWLARGERGGASGM